MQPVISLCMPTNGVIEWVFPALDSIYSQNVDYNEFEEIFLLFGKETKGLPEDLLKKYINKAIRIPMKEGLRSLNLSWSLPETTPHQSVRFARETVGRFTVNSLVFIRISYE